LIMMMMMMMIIMNLDAVRHFTDLKWILTIIRKTDRAGNCEIGSNKQKIKLEIAGLEIEGKMTG